MSMEITLSCSMCGAEKTVYFDSDQIAITSPVAVVIDKAKWRGQQNGRNLDIYCSKTVRGMKGRPKKTWNGGSIQSAMKAANDRTENAIASGCKRCPDCQGKGIISKDVCPQCGGAGFLVPADGMPPQSTLTKGVL